ncbi:uncharacterized protein A4U43_C04F2020 [Asparagus officinalis]|uniref:Uncharacterized protein n=1 Tax=Asparagus officinalis TaxID=4686 RepID=A0A5P1EXK7_ASPOF|nr:uncharacterized protein A4U43_C04F2020 [Asparagus officinalis]
MEKTISIALMAPKKGNLVLIMILACLLSGSFAGGHRKFINKSSALEDVAEELPMENEEESIVHPRILVVKTNDYGRYNPTPRLSKPRFKLIPN